MLSVLETYRKWLVALTVVVFLTVGMTLASVCTCTGTCNLTTATWTCPGDGDGIPDADDDVICASGCNLTIPAGTYTNNYFRVLPLGTATVTGTVIWNFDGPTFTFCGRDHYFAIGDEDDDRGTFVSSGKDLRISWTGAGSAAMSLAPSGNGSCTDTTSTNYTSVTMRGVERAPLSGVLNYSRGATAPTPDTNMVDCLDGQTAPTTGAVGDTIVFTTGKSQDFWYEVTCYPDQCTGAGTANAGFPGTCCAAADTSTANECTSTTCGNGPCDYQITRNSTGSTPGSVASSASWSSMVVATQNAPFGAAGAALHATPIDSDANGVANGEGTLPAVGDKFVVFKPVLIQGGTNPITNGTTAWRLTSGSDWKYVELNKIGGNFSENCDAALQDGEAPLWDMGTRITSPEGATEFVNAHNFAARQSTFENSYTNDPDDAKPNNEPRTYRHWYIHDVDATVGTTCPGQGVTTAARGMVFGIDSADRTHDGIRFEGLHIARWGSKGGIELTDVDQGSATRRDIRFYDTLVHDYPGISGYGTECNAIVIGDSSQTLFDGLSMWNLGQNATGCNAIASADGVEHETGSIVTFRVDNAFIVNVDSNTLSAPFSAGGVLLGSTTGYQYTTRGMTLSNSYIANIIGGAAWGGNLLYSFVKNIAIDDDPTGTCTTDNNGRSAIQSPVSAIGNVITRSVPLSCMTFGIAVTIGSAPSAFTDRTRKIISNVMFGMDDDSGSKFGGLAMRNSPTTDIDFYNNIVDLRAAAGNTVSSGILLEGTYGGKLTAFYNIFANATEGNSFGIDFGTFATSGTLDEGYNRFININAADPVFVHTVDRNMAASDRDSDLQDIFNDPWSNGYLQKCDSPDKTRNPWGGPVGPLRFGINSFNHFHPAVLPLMDADAFKLRYNWTSCGAVQQDAIPR